MKIFKKLFDFYIYSSLHVALAVVCLVFITIHTDNLDKHSLFLLTVFFGTIVGYNFLKYCQFFSNKNFHSKKYYAILAVTFLAIIGFLLSLYFLSYSAQKLILIEGCFVLSYPFLRKWGFIKLFFVSFVVAFISVYIPFQITKSPAVGLYISFFQRFLILTSLLIPFEIMDSKTDDKTLNTLPQLFGIFRTKFFGILLVIPAVVLEFLKSYPNYLFLPISVLTVFFISHTNWKRNKYFTSFWVESVPVFWWIFLVIFT